MPVLTKDIILQRIYETGVDYKDAKGVLELLLELIKSTLEKGEEVKISNFGRWQVANKNPRRGRNPHTGEKIEITARRVITFHPAAKFRNDVNQT